MSLVQSGNQIELTLHAAQMEVFKNRSRFRVMVAGRRTGKCIGINELVLMGNRTYKPAWLVEAGDIVMTVNERTYELELKPVVASEDNGARGVVKVSTHRGDELIVTPNHPILTQDGWVEAGDLTADHFVASYSKEETREGEIIWVRVQSVTPHGESQTLDLQIQDNHNFVVGNVVTHNTHLAVTEIIRAAKKPKQRVWYVAPTYRMAKDIVWNDLKSQTPSRWVKNVHETNMIIWLINGTQIQCKGADKPNSLRGVGLDFIVLDEVQNIQPDAWNLVLRPTLASTGGRALFLGTPLAFNLLHTLYQHGQDPKKTEWASWQFPTIMSPFIPQMEIDAAREDLDEKSFAQEFLACLPGNTPIKLYDGSFKEVVDVRPGDVLSHLSDSGLIVPCTVEDGGFTGVKETEIVMLENGETFEATYNHKMKVSGQKVELQDCEYLERFVDGGLRRLLIVDRKSGGHKPVYNIRVDSHDHSYLLADGTNTFNSFVSMSGRVYYPFDRALHVGTYMFNPSRPVWVGQDFNIDPMSSVILQPQRNGEVWAVDEIVLPSASTNDVVAELEKRFWRYVDNIVIYPDATGSSRQHARGESDLDIFREKGFGTILHHSKNPPISDRVNAVNRMLRNARGDVRLKIDRGCGNLIRSLDQTIYRPGSREINKKLGTDHACFHPDQLVKVNGSMMRFADIPQEGCVAGHEGSERGYVAGGKTIVDAEMVELSLSDGTKIRSTLDHKFLTTDGWAEAKDLKGRTLCNQRLLAELCRSIEESDTISAGVASMTRPELAGFVVRSLSSISTTKRRHVLGHAPTVSELSASARSDAYCLHVPDVGMFEVGGVIASNSDALGYCLEYEFPIRKYNLGGISI